MDRAKFSFSGTLKWLNWKLIFSNLKEVKLESLVHKAYSEYAVNKHFECQYNYGTFRYE